MRCYGGSDPATLRCFRGRVVVRLETHGVLHNHAFMNLLTCNYVRHGETDYHSESGSDDEEERNENSNMGEEEDEVEPTVANRVQRQDIAF